MTVPGEDAGPRAAEPVRDPVERLARHVERLKPGRGLASLARRWRRPAAALAAAWCSIWMYVAFFVGSTITVSPAVTLNGTSITVQCGALASLFAADQAYAPDDFAALSDDPPPMARDIDEACDRERVASCAVIAGLAAPSAILTAIALFRRRCEVLLA